MSARLGPRTPYEVRLELLQLAFDILKHNAELAKADIVTTDVIAEAEKMNTFVSKANTQ